MKRLLIAAVLAVVTATAATPLATAATPTNDVNALAAAAFANLADFDATTSAVVEQPLLSPAVDAPAAPTLAVSSSPFNGFPAAGASLILSSGYAENVDDAASPNGEGEFHQPVQLHGTDLEDVTNLKFGINVRPGGSCLTFDYRLMTNENLPPSLYHESLIAQIDASVFSNEGGDNATVAPGNFAVAQDGSPASVVSLAALFTDFPANTSRLTRSTTTLTATTPITPGAHALYLSISDDGDDEVDTAAQVSGLRVGTLAGGVCGPFIPSNSFTLGKLKLDKKKGSATLGLSLESPGAVTVYDRSGPKVTIAAKKNSKKNVALIKKTTLNVAAGGAATIAIKPTRAGLKKLKAKGRLRVKVGIANKPTGGNAKVAKKTITLKLTKKKRKK